MLGGVAVGHRRVQFLEVGRIRGEWIHSMMWIGWKICQESGLIFSLI